jgi:ABC-type Fe3+/spermidine/putrescine transport system ATPase subunit
MLEVRGICKDYEDKPLLKGISFSVRKKETVCLLGPSGSGKSTLLRIIAGLEPANAGAILWDGRDVSGMPVHTRNFGLMFQDYALFPHKNVYENVAFGLRMHNLPRQQIRREVERALDQVEMGGFARRRVTDLSGGEQQRVAFARALAPRPKLLMLDEPLGALDRTLKEQLLGELRSLLHETGIPTIYVTHDQQEAFSIADRLLIMRSGSILQDGRPEQVLRSPKNAWVAGFLGLGNLLPGEAATGRKSTFSTSAGPFCLTGHSRAVLPPGMPVLLLFLPTAVKVVGQARKQNGLAGRVSDVYFQGDGFRVLVSIGRGLRFSFLLPQRLRKGEQVNLSVDPGQVRILPREEP